MTDHRMVTDPWSEWSPAQDPRPSTFPRVLIGYDAGRMFSGQAASTVERVGQQWRWLSPEQPWAVAAAAALTGLILVVSAQIEPSGDERTLDALAYAMIVVCGAALLALRRHPVAALAVVAEGEPDSSSSACSRSACWHLVGPHGSRRLPRSARSSS